MKQTYKAKDLSPGVHYLILIEKRTSVPGDERSRTHPGHGYPAHTVSSWSVMDFGEDRAAWEEEVRSRRGQPGARIDFVPMRTVVPSIKVSTTIEIE